MDKNGSSKGQNSSASFKTYYAVSGEVYTFHGPTSPATIHSVTTTVAAKSASEARRLALGEVRAKTEYTDLVDELVVERLPEDQQMTLNGAASLLDLLGEEA